ncbi:MAG: hypothetical protein ACXAAT_18000 [Candidatus Hodarchaeales archaeon]|jgi:hypothetical protein
MSNKNLFGKGESTPTVETPKVDKAKEELKKHRKDLKDGKIQLTRQDFEKVGGDDFEKDFQAYESILKKKAEHAREEWDDDSWVNDSLTEGRATLHTHDRFKKYTGVSKRSEAKASGIEQLDKANELSNAVLKSFEDWAKAEENEQVKAFSDYLSEIGMPGSIPSPEFTCYTKGFNPVKTWIKKEFGKDSK